MSLNAHMALVFLSNMETFPRQSIIGQTYPISEEDALLEIEARAASTRFDKNRFGNPSEWSALDSVHLPDAVEANTRLVTPFHKLGFGIPDERGDIIYPAGFTFNPLEHAKLPGRIIVTQPDRIEWALGEAGVIDMVLVAGARPDQVLDQSGRSVFLLGKVLAERLGVTHAPTVITQVGAQLELREIAVSTVPTDNPDTNEDNHSTHRGGIQ